MELCHGGVGEAFPINTIRTTSSLGRSTMCTDIGYWYGMSYIGQCGVAKFFKFNEWLTYPDMNSQR